MAEFINLIKLEEYIEDNKGGNNCIFNKNNKILHEIFDEVNCTINQSFFNKGKVITNADILKKIILYEHRDKTIVGFSLSSSIKGKKVYLIIYSRIEYFFKNFLFAESIDDVKQIPTNIVSKKEYFLQLK